MSKFIMALDAGTTSNRCILFNEDGEICSMAQKEFRRMFPNPGWVEHDANEIWSTQLGVAVEAMSKIGATAADIAAIGITNQRETAIVWNKETGEPVYNAIVWQCRRTADIADALKKKGLEDSYRKKTGLIIDAYFSATKIKWILDNVKGARKLAEEGKLLFGTVETWLIWKLTKGEAHVKIFWQSLIFRRACCQSRCRQAVYMVIQTRHILEVQYRLPVQQETSRQLCSDRPAFPKEKRRIHMVQAVSF